MNKLDSLQSFAPILRIGAATQCIVGLALMLAPQLVTLSDPAPATAVLLIRWLGILLLAYSISVALSAPNPVRHWPVFLAGFLAMPLMILFTLPAIFSGTLPGLVGGLVLAIFFAWAIPSGLLLLKIAESPPGGSTPTPVSADLELSHYTVHDGQSLDALSREAPVLLVLLRHLGCTFCRETLADIAAQRREIEATGARIVFVHMGEDDKTRYLFERYRIDDLPRISDPEARLYSALGLERASLFHIYGPSMWRYTVQSILLDGHGMGQIVGDRFQMPGVFLIHNGSVVSGFRHARISDHPDYLSIVSCIAPPEEIQY